MRIPQPPFAARSGLCYGRGPPPLASRRAFPLKPSRDIARLIEIMAALRTPGSGCPWDLEQNFQTIAPYTLEEAYEVADAIARGDVAGLKDELGDLLLQVVFHARMAEEQGAFDFGAVVEGITAKLIRRHPHVFADEQGRTAQAVKGLWERIKAQEKAEARPRAAKAPAGALAGVPVALPALTRALKLQEKASRVGFDWNDPRAVLAKIREEADEIEADIDSNAEQRAGGARGRRSAVCGGQSRPPFRRRPGSHAARHQFEIRAPLCLDRARAGRARQAARAVDLGRDGRAVGCGEGAEKTGASSSPRLRGEGASERSKRAR